MSSLRYRFIPLLLLALLFVSSILVSAQDVPPPGPSSVQTNLEVRVSGLPSFKAQSGDVADVLATALAMILKDKDLCCDTNSALADRLPQSDPVSLKDVAAKLQGRQLRTDGRPVTLRPELVTPAALNSGQLIGALRAQHAPLMLWKDHLFVVSGAVYDEAFYNDGTQTYVLRKFLLLDPRYSDARREAVFSRETDDLNTVQGFLFVTVNSQ